MGSRTQGMKPIVLLPGLGADQRMFHRQVGAVPGLVTPDWLAPEPRETLRHYAERMAAAVREASGDEPLVLGGVSMGGMVALEMGRHLGRGVVREVVLIGSCRHPRAASGLLRMCERASRWSPRVVLDKGRVLAPLFLGRGGTLEAEDRGLLCRMARELPVDFIRWAARAIMEWEGCEEPGVPVRAIHGRRDWVIPLKGVRADRVIEGGIHVLNLSHAAEVNRFIAGGSE